MDWIIERLHEKSTWAAIITTVGTLIGRTIAPEMTDAITSIGMSIVTIILAVSKTKKD